MRPERLYLSDIVGAADQIATFLANATAETFQASDLLQSAVLHKLSVIGEAAARIPAPLAARHPEVPWRQIVAFRNVLIHAYFGLDWDVVWRAATIRCPELRARVAAILEAEFGGAEAGPDE